MLSSQMMQVNSTCSHRCLCRVMNHTCLWLVNNHICRDLLQYKDSKSKGSQCLGKCLCKDNQSKVPRSKTTCIREMLIKTSHIKGANSRISNSKEHSTQEAQGLQRLSSGQRSSLTAQSQKSIRLKLPTSSRPGLATYLCQPPATPF